MKSSRYSISIVKERAHRAVAYLVCPGSTFANAGATFTGKSDVHERKFRYGIDRWMQGLDGNRQISHGWDKSTGKGKYLSCYVFKSKNQRMYGFLVRPASPSGAELCVLVHRCAKNTHHTDLTVLDRVAALSKDLELQIAIDRHFEGDPLHG